MPGFHQVEEFGAVGDVDGSTAQLIVERGVVQQVQVLEHQQACCLVIGMQRDERAEIVKGLLVHQFGMLDELSQVHNFTSWPQWR